MRRLLLLRHAKTERDSATGKDRDRCLETRGQEDAPKMGTYMARHGIVPEMALISPATRTQQTWGLLRAQWPMPPIFATRENLYNADMGVLLSTVHQTPNEIGCLLILGHNPGLHELAMMLIADGHAADRRELEYNLPTAGLVVIDHDAKDWRDVVARSGRLDRFVTPKTLPQTDAAE